MVELEHIYTFKVGLKMKVAIHRTIELKGANNLHQFAEAILEAFGFVLDHSFGFYDDVYRSKEAYTLFYDYGNPINRNEKSVKMNYIHNVFKPNKKMVFLFDYGDNWIFLVECLGVADPVAGKIYPVVTKKIGKAPEQYPRSESCDDDDDEDSELSS